MWLTRANRSTILDSLDEALQEKSTLVRGENGHQKLIGEGQKSFRHQKLNVTKGGTVESIGVVVTFKVRHQ